MPLKVCVGCSRITSSTRCPDCQTNYNRRQYDSRRARGKRTGTTAAYRKARKQAMARANGRCEYINGDGIRCIETTSLECHHIAGDPLDHRLDGLIVVCHGHHMELERRRRSNGR